jgi:magnesium-transporting ATPase (P-type)
MAFLGGVVLRESPLNSIQMLWVNLIMDTFASLALATEPPNDELLKRQPYGKTEYLITPQMYRFIGGQAIYQIIVLVTVLFLGPRIFGVPSGIGEEHWSIENGVHFTLFFNIFVFMQVFNEINARKLKKEEINVFAGFFNNPLFLVIQLITIALQILFVNFGGKAIKCAPLTLQQHGICIAIGSLALIVGVLIKLVPESIFDKIHIFKEKPLTIQELDDTLHSKFKKRSSLKLKEANAGFQ